MMLRLFVGAVCTTLACAAVMIFTSPVMAQHSVVSKCHSGSNCPNWPCVPNGTGGACNCCYRTGGSYECVMGSCFKQASVNPINQ